MTYVIVSLPSGRAYGPFPSVIAALKVQSIIEDAAQMAGKHERIVLSPLLDPADAEFVVTQGIKR